MVKTWLKYARKSRYSKKIGTFLEALDQGDLSEYHVQKLSGTEDLYKVRLGQIRIILQRQDDDIFVVSKIQERGDVYKDM